MGMDLNFVAISKDLERLKQLKDYINKLYDLGYNDNAEISHDRVMLGYDSTIVQKDEYYLLCGCHRKCTGYDLGYWCKKENKDFLLEDIIYLEERQDDTYVYRYYPDSESEDGMLASVKACICMYTGEVVQEYHGIPNELINTVVNYLRYEKIE